MKKYLTDRQIGDMLGGKSTVTIWRMRQRGQLPPAKKINRQNLTPEDEVQAAVERLLNDEDAVA